MDKLFLTVLNMSLTGSFVIAVICLARLLLKKAPKIISYCLWLVAGFRLVLPFSIESVFSLLPFKAQTIPTDIATQSVPRIDSGIALVDNAVSSILPAATPSANINPLQIWTTIGSFLWFTGAALMIIYGVVSFIILKRKMSEAAHIRTNIYETQNIKSPFVLGFFKPKIYLPVDLAEQERNYILLHEQTHIRRHDHIIKFAAFFILSLHWFNPLAWAAFLLMGVDMEMSCDERVLKEIGPEIRKDYSLSLLSLATERSIIGGSPLAFGEGGVKGRIKNVLKFKKSSRVIIVIAVALVVVLSVGFAVNRITEGSILDSITPMTMDNVDKEPHFSGTVTEVNDNDILVSVSESDDVNQIGDPLRVSLNVELKDSMTNFTVGDRVTVYYNGTIEEVYPGQVKIVYAIVLTSPDMTINMDDLYALSSMRTPYVGDNSAVAEIVNSLPRIDRDYTQQFFSIGDDYGMDTAPYRLTVYYEPYDAEISDLTNITVPQQNSVLLFSLIKNLEEICYAFRTTPSDGELDIEAYASRLTYRKDDITKYLETIGLDWDDFSNDWNGSIEKMYETPSVTAYEYEAQSMTLEDVRTLAKKGDDLLFEDFRKYEGANTSSNLDYYIMVYSVEEDYRLIVRSNPSGKPDSVDLENVWDSVGSGIDIRYGDIDEFLGKWPIVMLVNDDTATPSGVTITLKNVTDNDYSYGEGFTIQRKTDNGWTDVVPIADQVINDIAYSLPAMGNEEITIEWELIYGELPAGDYRIVKSADFIRSPGDYDKFTLYAAFTLD